MSNYVVRYVMSRGSDKHKDIPVDTLSAGYTYLVEHKDDEYYTLSVFDLSKNLVIKIFERSLGETRAFEEDGIVRIREEYLNSEEERNMKFIVHNIHEDTGICTISIEGSSENVELMTIESIDQFDFVDR